MNNCLYSLLVVLFYLMTTTQSRITCNECFDAEEKAEIECMISDFYLAANKILSGESNVADPMIETDFNTLVLNEIFSSALTSFCINREERETESTDPPSTTDEPEDPEPTEEGEGPCPDGNFESLSALTATGGGLYLQLLRGIGNAFGIGHMAFSCDDDGNVVVRIANTFFVEGEDPVFVNDVWVFMRMDSVECGQRFRAISFSSLGVDQGLVESAQDAAEPILAAADSAAEAAQ